MKWFNLKAIGQSALCLIAYEGVIISILFSFRLGGLRLAGKEVAIAFCFAFGFFVFALAYYLIIKGVSRFPGWVAWGLVLNLLTTLGFLLASPPPLPTSFFMPIFYPYYYLASRKLIPDEAAMLLPYIHLACCVAVACGFHRYREGRST